MKSRSDARTSPEAAPAPARLLAMVIEEDAVLSAVVPGHRLLGKIGEGGMAEVYLAEQEQPIRREVAVKVIKPGMDSVELLARFEIERQVLAMMDHPGIARVHEAGLTTQGRPFFAMELVDGPPVTEWCVEAGLSIRARIELFIQICGAVQHAHLKGILHRDLKPSNILIQTQGGGGVPKVIDFGIAKAIGEGHGNRPSGLMHWTQPGRSPGTPAYMSPEQAQGRRDLDLRSDLYSLGVVLFELLTGRLPFVMDPERGTEALVQDILTAVARKPSEVVRTEGRLGEASELAGDLDCIVLKALERDRERRYASAAEFAADLVRHLRHEPVQARPPSIPYLLGRLIRRHWLPACAVGVMWLSILAALGISVWQTRVARGERNAAQRAQQRAERISTLMQEIVDAPDPTEDGREVRVIDVLHRAEGRMQRELADDPDTLAEIRYSLAGTFDNLGDLESAERLYRQVLSRFEIALGTNHVRTAECAGMLGRLVFARGRDEEGLHWLEEALFRLERGGMEVRSERVWAQVQLSGALLRLGRTEPAERLMLEALPAAEALGEEDRQAEGVLLHNLSLVHAGRGNIEGEMGFLRRSIEVLGRIPEARVDLATAYNNLGLCHRERGELAEAEALVARSLEMRRESLGTNHALYAASLSALAGVVSSRQQHERAVELSMESLEIAAGILPPRHHELYGILLSRGGALLRSGRGSEALPFLQELYWVCLETRAEDKVKLGTTRVLLGGAMLESGWIEEAGAHLREGNRLLAGVLPVGHPLLREAGTWLERLGEIDRPGH